MMYQWHLSTYNLRYSRTGFLLFTIERNYGSIIIHYLVCKNKILQNIEYEEFDQNSPLKISIIPHRILDFFLTGLLFLPGLSLKTFLHYLFTEQNEILICQGFIGNVN